MKITILGPQGSGKTTQAKLLAEKLNLPVIDIGQLIRTSFDELTFENRQAYKLMKQGQLVPNDYAAKLLQERLSQLDCKNGYILDGYPRSLAQLELFDTKTDKVIFISVADIEAIKRLKARGRIDDTDEAIKNRLAWYHSKTSQVLNYYKAKGILHVIPSQEKTEQTFTQILALFTV